MEKFRDIGFKLTPQRLAILDYLEGNTGHPSAEEIYQSVSKRFPTMSFATVYNTLTVLKEKGSIADLTIDPGKRRFDPNTAPHNHLMCLSCHCIVDIRSDFCVDIPEEERHGFSLRGNHIEFYGICPECKGADFSSSKEAESCA